MDRAYRDALRRYKTDPTDYNYIALSRIYRRMNPDLKIEATLYPFTDVFDYDINDPLYRAKFDITDKILSLTLDEALDIRDDTEELLSMIPYDIVVTNCQHRCDIVAENSIRKYINKLLDGALYCRDPECATATGIHGGLTHGKGDLDYNGYWEFPCPYLHRIDEISEGGEDE